MRFMFFCQMFVWCLGGAFAQDRPVFLPEDIDSDPIELKCFCKPGVANKSRSRGLDISYLHKFRSLVKEETGFPLSQPLSQASLENISFNLRFPIINQLSFKLLGGLVFLTEQFNYQRIGPDYREVNTHLNGRSLKSSGFELTGIKSWNERIYTAFRLRNTFNGDFPGIIKMDQQYAVYTATGVLGIKRDDNNEWGVGLNLVSSFRNTIALPFIVYNKTFNDKWGIETVLPALVNVRYNPSPEAILLAGIRYHGRSYSIQIPGADDHLFHLNHSELRAMLTLERQIRPWVWMDISAGYQYNFSMDYDSPEDISASFEVEPGSSPFIKIGLFISPPDSFLK